VRSAGGAARAGIGQNARRTFDGPDARGAVEPVNIDAVGVSAILSKDQAQLRY
jgi:hypothetical protein